MFKNFFWLITGTAGVIIGNIWSGFIVEHIVLILIGLVVLMGFLLVIKKDKFSE